MKRFIQTLVLGWILASITACAWRSSLDGDRQDLYPGVTYNRLVRSAPRRMVIHIVKIDLREKGIDLFVTPGDPNSRLPLKAMTTSQFAKKYGLQVAINGDAFSPWHSNTILDYYPHTGDDVAPTGFAASGGTAYAQDTDDEPTLYFSRTNQAQFFSPPGKLNQAISGTDMLVRSGQILPGLSSTAEPRTAVALSKANKELILIVVDGRQKGYSEGATLEELAKIMLENGGVNGMNLDGGGSTTLVIQEPNGSYNVVNSPINNDIPGRERDVGNHLGIYAGKRSE